MKVLFSFTFFSFLFFVPGTFGQYEEDCARLEFWTSYLPQNPVHPTMPYNAALICDTPGVTTPISLWARFGYIGNWDLAGIQDGWGYGVFYSVLLPGEYAFDVSCLTPTDTLQPGETLYFRKVVTGAPSSVGLGGAFGFYCTYMGQIWTYTVPDLTTGVGSHGLPVGINIQTEGLTVRITSDTADEFWILDIQGKFVHEGVVSGDVNIRMPSPGVYILRTNHGTRRFFVSD